MSLLGKKWPTPVARPMAPFYAAGLIILYGVNSLSNTIKSTDEWKNDPRNTGLKSTGGH
ncbi:uncharacterized protein K452DRAFT_283645 [Aplosporella prunicola CBS 121167]|uniref:ATP synthase subunit J, mitochondrial n=1 Tax=Aplosporella prunicola CBS 121167 TaxID=1176127 RepID=A0A6A6BSD6_9PEZI|nr:uncharacterized protein K452DRAFT_283645 [Aplosporella prunicola CBS 121167]KAF2146373.1 hypothetical protein K452DRAFT_283645 [Aplosporella prunicola CBS 121167]